MSTIVDVRDYDMGMLKRLKFFRQVLKDLGSLMLVY